MNESARQTIETYQKLFEASGGPHMSGADSRAVLMLAAAVLTASERLRLTLGKDIVPEFLRKNPYEKS